MAYTVTKLAQLSGVSVRTLHFYDEAGLLKPAYYGSNGYRYYEEEQLLILQQILFFRELGFELKQIHKILGRGDFDKIVALASHRKVLEKNVARTKALIKTIDQTIEHLKGKKKMKDQEMYRGFSKEKQAEYEQQLISRFGDKMKETIAESRRNIKNWTKEDWEASHKEFASLCQELVKLMLKPLKANAPEVQNVIRRHHQWLKKFWTPTKESYAGLGQLYLEGDFRKMYDDLHHPKLADFLAEAMSVFAEKELA